MRQKKNHFHELLVLGAAGLAIVIIGAGLYALSNPSPYLLEVRVSNASSGVAVEGAAVSAAAEGGGTALQWSSPSGIAPFAFGRKPASISLSISKSGFAAYSRNIAAPDSGVFSALLSPSTVSARPSPGVAFLIVSDRGALAEQYGKGGARDIEAAMDGIATSVELGEGMAAKVEFISSRSRQGALGEITGLLSASGAKYLLLVGGDSAIPFQQEPNPLLARRDIAAFGFISERDALIPTDVPYSLGGKVAVGRIVAGTDDSASSGKLLLLLQNAAALHSARRTAGNLAKLISRDNYGPYFDALLPSRQGISSAASASSDFARTAGSAGGDSHGSTSAASASSDAVSNLPSPALVSPPLSVVSLLDFAYLPGDADRVRQSLSQGSIVYLSLHGNDPGEMQVLLGRDGNGDALVLNPAIAGGASVGGRLFLADSCYGATPLRTNSQSIPVAVLSGGAAGFVGATTTAFSNSDALSLSDAPSASSLGVSNALLYLTARNAFGGMRIGDALNEARGGLSPKPVDELTRIQFILYGDPTLRIA
ncbi:hypothetical protein HY995_00830 [Candidatus Micrarchaeota archaeon]|nr:hypothetical protein [Candidatus Micrarchaeota archaeon]